jgi:hypothetical protein
VEASGGDGGGGGGDGCAAVTERFGSGGCGMARWRRLWAEPERGDVAGWVMIAVMTAALVMAILVPFREAIVPAMTAAIEDVLGQMG